MDYLTLILGISILLQFTAVFFALRLIKITGKRIAWILISSAIFLMAIRRCVTFYSVISGELTSPPDLISESIALIISALILAGTFYIGPLFLSIKRSDNSLRIANRAYKVLSNCNQAVVHSTDELKLLHEICRIIVEKGGYHLAWIGFAEQDKAKTIRPVAQMGFEEGYLETVNITWADAKRGKGLTGTAIRTGKPSAAQNILTDPAFESWRDQAIKRGYASSIALPLIDNSHSFGALNVYAAEPDAFAAEEVNLLTELAGDLAYGIVALRTGVKHQRAEEKLSVAYDALGSSVNGVIITDLEGKINYANPSFLSMFEYADIGQVDGKHAAELFPSEKVQKFSDVEAIIDKAKGETEEFLANHKDGTVFYVEVSFSLVTDQDGNDMGRMASFVDISSRKQAEEALKKSEEKYRNFFDDDLTGDYISTPDGRLLFCNPAFIQIFGFESMEEAMNCNLYSLYPDTEVREAFLKELKIKKKLKLNEVKLRNCQGEPIYVIENIVGNFNQNDELVEMRGYLFDLTENKKLEEQFLGAQKMEAIGQLAGGVAHDFNNLLTVINGYSEILLDKLSDDSPIKKDIKQIRKAGEKAGSLTSQLLAFSRRQIIQPKVLNLNSIVTDIEKMLHRLIGEDIKLITMLNEELGNIKADKGQMDQVIMNLAVNARDAMPEGGNLTIETTNVYLDNYYVAHHISVQPGAYVMLAISDTGIGMNSETKSRIFDPFFTTKERDKGTGLGLSTVYGIVKQSGGNIWVYSEPGKGTTFKIYFPQVEEKAASDVQFKPSFGSLSGSETILLVEDDYEVRELSRSFLKNYGYKVLDAENGEKALQLCEQYKEMIHLIVTDVVMPKMGGRVLADNIVTLHPEIKVLFVSGYTDNAIVHHGILDADVAFLAKPFSPQALAYKVREVLETPKLSKKD